MKETYVCVDNIRNGKAYRRASDIAQKILQKYPNQPVYVISLDDYKKVLADERAKTIKEFVKSLFANEVIDKSVVRRVAEQMKGENHV